jgi:hypothetical protein
MYAFSYVFVHFLEVADILEGLRANKSCFFICFSTISVVEG